MENIVKQIQLIALVIILAATVIAFGIEIYQMIVPFKKLLWLICFYFSILRSFSHG